MIQESLDAVTGSRKGKLKQRPGLMLQFLRERERRETKNQRWAEFKSPGNMALPGPGKEQ